MKSRKDPANPLTDLHISTVESDCVQLIEALPAAIYTCDLEGRITFFNAAAVNMWGRVPELGKDLWCGSLKMFTPEGKELPMDDCPMAITLREKRPITGVEIIIERPDGSRLNVLPNPKPLYDASGVMNGAMNLLINITEKKKRDQALFQSEKKYQLLFDSIENKPDAAKPSIRESEDRYFKMIEEVEDYAILLLDEDGNILNWNKGAEKIKGYKEEEIVGKNFRLFYQEEDRKNKLPELLINRARTEGKASHEGWRLRKDGHLFWGSIVITAIHNVDNKVIGFSKVTRDLTDRKNAEDQLKQSAHEIEIRNKQLEEFAYVASHDLQEPLRKIRTFSEIMRAHLDDKNAIEKFVEKIDSAASRMTTLIKDILKYSHAGHEELFRTTDLNIVLETVLEDFELLIEQRNAKITHNRLPVLQAIPIQMQQLFSNLLSNAIKFTNEPPVIEIACERISNGQLKEFPALRHNIDYFKISFTDNGIGFDPQYSDQVFKLFKRLHDTSMGTGVGLALCKKIVENHNGQITVASQPNKGTTFFIFLPAS